ncbi:oligosaccharide flippase family protein [Candidatus Daviesbacteria bacterium]|nr:oligosaccharide flippase family protein [Candidatus Daviesbacteria bacterium]
MLRTILKTATLRQSSITFVGTVLNGFLGALFYIVIARILGPAEFGLLTISITTLTLIADISDIGTNTGLIRFVSANLVSSKDKALRFLRLSLEVKFLVWAAVSVIIYFASPFLAEMVFHKEELVTPLRLAVIGVGGALLFTFATSSLQAYQRYFLWSTINILTNALRLILIIILGTFIHLNIENSLLIYITLPFFGFFVALFFLPAREILRSKNEFSLAKELFQYNIPVAIFTVIAAFSARLDIYLNAALLSAHKVGIYGAATQLVQVMPQLVSAIGLVAAPKFASFQNDEQMLVYLKKLQLLVTGLCLAGILFIPFVIYLIPLLFGTQYQEAILPFIFLFFAMLVFLFSVPVHNSVIFYFGRPDVFIWVSIGHLLIIGGLGYLMISNLGMVGASITVLIGTTFNFLYPLAWMLLKLRKK